MQVAPGVAGSKLMSTRTGRSGSASAPGVRSATKAASFGAGAGALAGRDSEVVTDEPACASGAGDVSTAGASSAANGTDATGAFSCGSGLVGSAAKAAVSGTEATGADVKAAAGDDSTTGRSLAANVGLSAGASSAADDDNDSTGAFS